MSKFEEAKKTVQKNKGLFSLEVNFSNVDDLNSINCNAYLSFVNINAMCKDAENVLIEGKINEQSLANKIETILKFEEYFKQKIKTLKASILSKDEEKNLESSCAQNMSEKEEMKINLGSEITDLITNLTNINDEFEKLNPTYVQLAYYLVKTYADNTSFGQQVIDAGKQVNNGYMQLDVARKIQFDK